MKILLVHASSGQFEPVQASPTPHPPAPTPRGRCREDVLPRSSPPIPNESTQSTCLVRGLYPGKTPTGAAALRLRVSDRPRALTYGEVPGSSHSARRRAIRFNPPHRLLVEPEPQTKVLPPGHTDATNVAPGDSMATTAALGRYEIVQRLGHGGMATVYLGRATGNAGFEKLVAIKVIHPHLAAEPEFVEMFLEEARIAAKIQSPHVAGILDLGHEDGLHFMVMEYIDGETLSGLIRQLRPRDERLPLPVVLRILIDACEGLTAVHDLLRRRRPPLRPRPSRHVAAEPDDRLRRLDQDRRLRPRQGHQQAPHPDRTPARQARVHVPRAGPRQAHHRHRRPVRARRRVLGAAHRQAPVRRRVRRRDPRPRGPLRAPAPANPARRPAPRHRADPPPRPRPRTRRPLHLRRRHARRPPSQPARPPRPRGPAQAARRDHAPALRGAAQVPHRRPARRLARRRPPAHAPGPALALGLAARGRARRSRLLPHPRRRDRRRRRETPEDGARARRAPPPGQRRQPDRRGRRRGLGLPDPVQGARSTLGVVARRCRCSAPAWPWRSSSRCSTGATTDGRDRFADAFRPETPIPSVTPPGPSREPAGAAAPHRVEPRVRARRRAGQHPRRPAGRRRRARAPARRPGHPPQHRDPLRRDTAASRSCSPGPATRSTAAA
jgi:hypothetical protein